MTGERERESSMAEQSCNPFKTQTNFWRSMGRGGPKSGETATGWLACCSAVSPLWGGVQSASKQPRWDIICVKQRLLNLSSENPWKPADIFQGMLWGGRKTYWEMGKEERKHLGPKDLWVRRRGRNKGKGPVCAGLNVSQWNNRRLSRYGFW